MRSRRSSNASSSVVFPCSPTSGVAPSTATMGRRRRAAAMLSPSRVWAFSRIRNASSAAWKSPRSTTSGVPDSWSRMFVIALVPAVTKGLHSGIRNLDPFRLGCGARNVALVPVPPFVRFALRVALRRILPFLLASECCHEEVAPDGAHRLIAAPIDEIGAVDAIPVADKCVVSVPFIHVEVGAETIGDGHPGDMFPPHLCLQARDIRLRRR